MTVHAGAVRDVGIATFDDLPTPFRSVAVDLKTARFVALDRGSLATAMRATMSLPLIFPAIEDADRLLVDGGAMNNIPADVARQMGADKVIAVNVGDLWVARLAAFPRPDSGRLQRSRGDERSVVAAGTKTNRSIRSHLLSLSLAGSIGTSRCGGACVSGMACMGSSSRHIPILTRRRSCLANLYDAPLRRAIADISSRTFNVLQQGRVQASYR